MLMGSKPAPRVSNPPFLHASQKGPAEAIINFETINLKFPLVTKDPKFTIPKIGWAPKANPSANLPFAVDRTETGNALPVYTDYKGGKTKVITIVRKLKGDVHAFKEDLEKVVGKEVTIRPGKVVIDGNYHMRVKLWLLALGF